MPQYISAAEAVGLIRDGDCLIYNNFLGMNNAEQLSIALNERFEAEGHPKDLTLYCTAGLGGWLPGQPCEKIVPLGGVKTVIMSHYGSMPDTAKIHALCGWTPEKSLEEIIDDVAESMVR